MTVEVPELAKKVATRRRCAPDATPVLATSGVHHSSCRREGTIPLRFSHVLTALRQAQLFLDANSAALGIINASGAREALDESVTRLDALAAERTARHIKGRSRSR